MARLKTHYFNGDGKVDLAVAGGSHTKPPGASPRAGTERRRTIPPTSAGRKKIGEDPMMVSQGTHLWMDARFQHQHPVGVAGTVLARRSESVRAPIGKR